MDTDPVAVSIVDGVAVLLLRNPPVNALDHALRSALLQAVVQADGDPSVHAVVITGDGKFFVAGADVREFDAAPREPLLNDVLLRAEACSKPVIAALNGAALGGGLELALACHYRCAVPSATVGFPEIKLGLLPGSGGTQRLPRLCGIDNTLELMLGGAPIGAARAHALGIVDFLLADGSVLDQALLYARAIVLRGGGPRRVCDLAVPSEAVGTLAQALRREPAATKGPRLLAPEFIVECVAASRSMPFAEALALARRRFEECRQSPASKALRHLFFAERNRPTADGLKPWRTIRKVAVVGAGTMGSGIAISLATAGYDVLLIDPANEGRHAGMRRVASTLDASAAKGRLSANEALAAKARVVDSGSLDAAAEADLVIEAVFEKLAVKQEVFAALDRVCGQGVVLASNTSTLDVDAIAAATGRPDHVVGMHFFSPANIMRLVEVVRGSATAPEAIAASLSVVRRMGKLGIVVGNGFGFVGNRMLYAYGRENQFMLLEGARPEDIDAALTSFGMAMGPNAVGDLAGLDVGYSVRKERGNPYGDPRYYRVADLLVEAGRLGQKTGRGMFRYEAGSRAALTDPEVQALIEAESARLGIVRRAIAAEEVVERCVFALINEGAKLLEEGVALSAADIDAIWCNGYGFPRTRGGPMHYANSIGLAAVVAGMAQLSRRHGSRDWTPAPLLAELAAHGASFAS